MSGGQLRGTLLAGLLVAASSAMAQDVPPDLAACRAETDAGRRLECYDHAIDRRNARGEAPVLSQAAASKETAQSREQQFGYQGRIARDENEKKKKEARALDELVATVMEISVRADGTLEIALDNGQVWAQNRPDPYFRLKVGDSAKIEPGMLGSFLMSGPAKRSTRVTRLR